ncbi:MAG: transcriptional regulator, TetR famil [Caulobacteraceae bacterium]|nr:transcriptional regulator, TetR famil [Caulobacteraceae bacterium]
MRNGDPGACDHRGSRPPTQRTLAKAQTRAKVLEAAQKLFSTRGYETTTIRDIAAEAGMTTGAVFAHFADKSALFHGIVQEGVSTLKAVMREAIAEGGSAEDSLLRMFMAGYAHYFKDLPLARAAMSVSWTTDTGHAVRRAAPVITQLELIEGVLRGGIDRGEFLPDDKIHLRSEMLYQAYLWNYRTALFDSGEFDVLEMRMREQIVMLLAEVRPKVETGPNDARGRLRRARLADARGARFGAPR